MDKEFLEVFGDDSVVKFTEHDVEQHRDMLQEAAFEGYIVPQGLFSTPDTNIVKCFALTDKGMEYIALLQEQQAAKAISDVIGKPYHKYPLLFKNVVNGKIILAANPYMGMVIFANIDLATGNIDGIGEVVMVQTPFHENETWVRFQYSISIDSSRGVIRSDIID